MLLVFSSDFGKQTTLFFPENQPVSQSNDSLESGSTALIENDFDGSRDHEVPSVLPVKVPLSDGSVQAQAGDNHSNK
jgi:hypothetical protein